jgi:1,4-dihydroxy-2-naphthoate octaprenyltransferase
MSVDNDYDHDYDQDQPPAPPASAWIMAARPKTLPAAIVPVWAGGVLSWHLTGSVSYVLLAFILFSAIAIQIATNFFNDALDHKKGADTKARLGPTRASASGLIPHQAVTMAGIACLMVATTLSLPLIGAAGWPVIAIGLPSLYFSFGYTGGPLPLAYRGLGEIFVILFFGFIAVAGTVFILTGKWTAEAILLGFQVGLYSTALIAINNLRDIDEDKQSNKRTLAVRFGLSFGRIEIAALCLTPAIAGLLWLYKFNAILPAFLPLAILPLSIIISILVWKTPPSAAYNRYLGLAALQMILFVILFTAAMVLPT